MVSFPSVWLPEAVDKWFPYVRALVTASMLPTVLEASAEIISWYVLISHGLPPRFQACPDPRGRPAYHRDQISLPPRETYRKARGTWVHLRRVSSSKRLSAIFRF
ncbi:hypothetical protein BDN67DRAFT_970393, partial [Paxillus ammoniavirescens]